MSNKFRDYVETVYRDELTDIAEHGSNYGLHGLIFNKEIVELYNKYEKEIWEILEEGALKWNPILDIIADNATDIVVESLDGFKIRVVHVVVRLIADEHYTYKYM